MKSATFFTLLVLVATSVSAAFANHNYYPTQFIQAVASGKVQNDDLKNELNILLTSKHQRDSKGGPDTLGCDTDGVNGCYAQRSLGYDGARKVMFGKLHLKNDGNGFYVEDVYCKKHFGPGAQVGPNAIPNANIINCEHTWPQSKFSNNYPKDIQKSDLHHLFPTDSKANSIRGNINFTDVSSDNGDLSSQTKCNASKFGTSVTHGGDGFEPPQGHKGNVARALFYFSVRYKISIPRQEEEVLRRWNDLDPIDQEELNRNNAVFNAQANRNPFVDYPQLVNYISKF